MPFIDSIFVRQRGIVSKNKVRSPAKMRPIAIDLFSGCGGLTLGLKKAGFNVVAAVEIDPLACSTYRRNHKSSFLFESDIRHLDPDAILRQLGMQKEQIDLVAGCPPCQGFSSMRTKNGRHLIEEPMNDLVFEFVRIAVAIRPKAIMLENVPGLATDDRVEAVLQCFERAGYKCKLSVFNAADFGAPQRRKRLILVAALGREPALAVGKARRRSVRGAIGRMPLTSDSLDPLHNYQVRHTDKVQRMIENIPKDGGSRSDLPIKLRLACHDISDGFRDVYGRMSWKYPSPTITGGCINPSKGRFIHPEHDRAITLREAALLQGFPTNYYFDISRGRYATAQIIGNAFPPIFAQKHATALRKSLEL
ncbi:DNA cytosine methyltransferase [Mesorhizobium sp. M0676]|uniref:DNA cytosine methyltransferase n=1 Tax=Mesorhizobium sp. M0676 TaxID=2956984 RepID=UPI003335310E